MGQTYTVYAKLVFKDDNPKPFCDIIKQEISRRNFNRTGCNFDDPFECFKAVTSDNSGECPAAKGVWYSDFDANYGWEAVMYELFEKAIAVLENGSYIEIYPDSGGYRFRVKNGDVFVEDTDQEDEEEEDQY